LNNTPIKPLIFLHKTNKFYSIAAALAIWMLLTTGIVVLAINSNLFHKQYQCTTTEIAPLKNIQETPKNKLISHISKVYNIPKQQVYELYGVVKAYTSKGWPDTNTTLAIIATESAFKKHAVSSANAKGYMQVLKASGKPVTTETWQNVASGTELLREYRQQLGSDNAAIMAYNVGITAFKNGARPVEYLNKVKRNLEVIESI